MAEVRTSYIEKNIPFSKYCRKRTFIIDRKKHPAIYNKQMTWLKAHWNSIHQINVLFI